MGLLKVLATHSQCLGAAHGKELQTGEGSEPSTWSSRSLQLEIRGPRPQGATDRNFPTHQKGKDCHPACSSPTPTAPKSILASQQKPDSSHQYSQIWRHAYRMRGVFFLATPRGIWDPSWQTRDRTHAPWLEKLNPWTTREVLPREFFFLRLFNSLVDIFLAGLYTRTHNW